jgi:DNA transposition AAA+ family ATPase
MNMSDEAATGTEVTKADQALASSAHSRINIPLNLDNWKALPAEVQEGLLWFHQHLLDQKLSIAEAGEALNYDASTVFRVLKGTYEGSWKNVLGAIHSYRRVAENRGGIRANEFVQNSLSELIWAGLDYAMANNSITLITGESRMGKTGAALAWRDANNHGRSVYVDAPPYGGTKMLLRRIAEAVGVNKNLPGALIMESLARAFNRHRILIIDDAHRLLPGERAATPVSLEVIRDLHDSTHCAVALLATQRFQDELQKSDYQFEQIIGRIGMPVRLPKKIKADDYRPIVEQYIRRPSAELMKRAADIANARGRLGILVETLKVASKIASKSKATLSEEHVFKAIALRLQMMGETQYAKGT